MNHSSLLARPLRRAFITIVLACTAGLFAVPVSASNACLQSDGGIGGTGHGSEGSGVGGTGAPLPRDRTADETTSSAQGTGETSVQGAHSGIGGTGIVGTITGFASVCVNGIEVQYGSDTPIEVNGQPAGVAQLHVGQVVAIEAIRLGPEVRARRIAVTDAVVGPIGRLDLARGEAEVLGQKIELTDHTIFADRSPTTGGGDEWRRGDFVQVSGLRRNDGTIVASRIEQVPPRPEVSVSGPVTEIGENSFHVYGLRVDATSGAAPEPLELGRIVHAMGPYDTEHLRADHLNIEPRIPFGGRIDRLELQGYVRDRPSSHALELDRLRFEITGQTVIRGGQNLSADSRVQVSARLTPDRHWVADRIDLERADHRLDGSHERMHRGQSGDRGGREDNSGPGRGGRDDGRIDRPDSNRGPDMDRPERFGMDRPERLDRSGPH